MRALQPFSSISAPSVAPARSGLEPLRAPRRLPAAVRHDGDHHDHDEEHPFEEREELGEETGAGDASARGRFLVSGRKIQISLYSVQARDNQGMRLTALAAGAWYTTVRIKKGRAVSVCSNRSSKQTKECRPTIRGGHRDDVVSICLVLVQLARCGLPSESRSASDEPLTSPVSAENPRNGCDGSSMPSMAKQVVHSSHFLC